ncbi:MAG TPA: two-component regulator propeller domain-containing protein, partial [Prolixibacteraceae bacterium]
RVQHRIIYKQTVNAISSIYGEKRIYLGTTNGIDVLSLGDLKITDPVFFKGLNIQNLLCASNHKIYAYTAEVALLYADMNSLQTGKYLPDPIKLGSLLDNNITCLFEDFSGNLWVGHQGLGLSILNLNKKAFYSYKHDPSNPKSLVGNIVMCINGTTREIFVGMRQGGINVTSKQKSADGSSEFRVLSYQQQSGTSSNFNSIWDIARESDSVFWVSSNGGVAKLEKTRKGWIYGRPGEKPLYEGVVRKILIDKDRNIWVGTFTEGLLFFPALRKNPERKFYSFPADAVNPEAISNRNILSMLIDSKNRFWVGTNNGLNLVKTPYNQLDLSGKQKPDVRFKHFIATQPEKNFLNANEINSIFENSDGKIWLATQGGGINIMSPDSAKFTHITDENGLHGNDVLGILSDQAGRKWISTNKGIATFDATNKTKPFTYYNITDGLQGETYKVNSFYQSDDGEMFFGGDNGFSRFYPSQIKINPIPPKIGLTYFRFQNKIINIGDTISDGNIMTQSLDEMDHIELPFQKNSFSIGVGVHHYQYPEGNMIKYKLDGFFDRWITLPASNKYIYFSKLPYGKYMLHISGLSADNVEAKSERVFEIRILPPWYLAWYMRTLFLLLFIGTIGYLLYWLTNKQKISFQKKIDDISFENNENKMRFLTNIAHELRTPLSLVIAPIEDMQQNYTAIDAKWKSHLNLIYRNSNYLLTLINQIIDFRKLNAGKLQLNLQKTDLVSLVRDVVANFKGLESRRKTNLKSQLPDHAVLVDIDRQKIEEVLYNLLSNAFKHTMENNAIEVSLQVIPKRNAISGEEKEQVRITVFNEGKDISDEDKQRIFEQFYKVSEQVEGAGIGLSFSKSLIEMHKGTITVESVDGIGVAFHVDLPFDSIEIAQSGDNPVKSDPLWHEEVYDSEQVNVLENRGKEMTLVIVEDNIDLRTFLRIKLSEDYNCLEAGDGKEGYELITRILPDIVISDVVMSKMDGYELCEKVKENNKTCHIPIILLTANNAPDHIVS